MKEPNTKIVARPFTFEGKELKAVAIEGDVWYFANELQEMLGAKNIRGEINKLPEHWKCVVDAREINVGETYKKGTPRRTLVNTKGAIKIALRAKWSKADEFTEKIADLADRHYKGDLTVAQENVQLNAGRDQAGLERLAIQSAMFMEHPAIQRTTRRLEGIAARKAFTSTLGKHSVTPVGFGRCTNEIYTGTLGGKAKEVSKRMGLTKRDNLRDHLPTVDLIGVTLAEALATERIDAVDAQGDMQCASVCGVASHEVGQAIRRTRA